VHAAGRTRWKVTLLGINFDINAGSSIEKHAVKHRILGYKITCVRTMEIYGKRSSTSRAAELSGVCSHLASRSALKKGNPKITTCTGSCLHPKSTDLYSYVSLFVCFLFVLFVCLRVFLLLLLFCFVLFCFVSYTLNVSRNQ